jgi:putative Mn2+ efflux pump MntP
VARILVISLALALDAFGVSLGLGCGSELKKKEKLGIVFSFGFFQFFFAFLGAVVGNYIDANFFTITGYMSGIVILFLGILLFREGYKKEEECIYTNLTFWTYVVLGISVSIDALGVGFSILYNFGLKLISGQAIIIGIITAGLTILSFIVVRYIKRFAIVEKYADYIGGTILIIFGLKMIL